MNINNLIWLQMDIINYNNKKIILINIIHIGNIETFIPFFFKYIWYIIYFKYSMWLNKILYIEIKFNGKTMTYYK
jgi:hypothetical protein